jgi:peptide/nickel transport system permease protein
MLVRAPEAGPDVAVRRAPALAVHQPATVVARVAPHGRPVWLHALRKPLIVWPGAYLLVLGVAAATLPTVLHIDPYAQNLADSLQPPLSPGHILGTDQLGRDVLLRLVDGARTSLSVGFIAVAIALLVGGVLGLVAGFMGGRLDEVLMRLVDVKLAFPGLLAALVVVTVLGSGLDKVMIAVGLAAMPRYARVLRGSVLGTKGEPFVEAARSLGATDMRLMLAHILPQVVGPALTLATLGLAEAILASASLSFLGLGPQPPTAEWGLVLSEGRKYLRVAWWLAVVPGCAILTTVLAINLLGDALHDVLDPRSRHR